MRPGLRAILFSQPFSVPRLFKGGVQGFWYDMQDLSTMFQDTAGTTPVTATGQTVKRINDKSGNGHHLTNATGWLLLPDGPLNYLQGDGTTNFLEGASTAWGSDKLTVWAGASGSASATAGTIISFGAPGTQTASFDFGYFNNGILLYRRGSGAFGGRGTATVGLLPVYASAQADLSGTTQASECPAIQVNGVQGALTDYGTADSGTGNFGTYALKMGGGAAAFSGRIYQVIGVAKIAALAQVENYANSKTNNLAFVDALTFADTGAQPNVGTEIFTSPHAHVDFTTTATQLIVYSYNDIALNYLSLTELGVLVNGVWNQKISPGGLGVKANAITLTAGSKTVSVVNGPSSKPASSVIGTYVTRVTANAALTPVAPTSTARVLVYGDSIAVGADAATVSQNAWVVQVRAAYYPSSLAVEGYGFRSLHDDCTDSASITAFVAKIVAYNPVRLWICIGTNDWGLHRWASASAFGTQYAAMLDALHAAMPSLAIFCQTPIVRTDQATPIGGFILDDFRSQITSAATARPSFCTAEDGTGYVLTSDLDVDGIHPLTGGHTKIATAVRSALVI